MLGSFLLRRRGNFLECRRCILWRNATLVEQASKIWLRRIMNSACWARERSSRASRARCGPCTITRIGHSRGSSLWWSREFMTTSFLAFNWCSGYGGCTVCFGVCPCRASGTWQWKGKIHYHEFHVFGCIWSRVSYLHSSEASCLKIVYIDRVDASR